MDRPEQDPESRRSHQDENPSISLSRYGSISQTDTAAPTTEADTTGRQKSRKLKRRVTGRSSTDDGSASGEETHERHRRHSGNGDDDGDDDEEETTTESNEDHVRPRRTRFGDRNDSDRSSVHSSEHEMTLKDRQEQMNKRHPFGLPIWKPALYKKSRSVVRKANSALHSSPSSSPELFLNPGNILWLLVFGWWLAFVMFATSFILLLVPPDGYAYALVMRELALYLLWPFGRYVERHDQTSPYETLSRTSTASSHTTRSTASYAESGVSEDEETGLLVNHRRDKKRRKKSWTRSVIDVLRTGPAGCVYYLLYFTIIAPLMLLVSTICWLCVITIPMCKLTYILSRHLRRHPLSLRFKSSPSGQAHLQQTGQPAIILLCTYQAIGLQYYKYTYEGINIMFINLLPIVFFVILDDYVLRDLFPDSFITAPATIFALSLASVIPLSYFIGMGVSSVSAQSSMGVGAFLNASFGSIIEIILYAVALMSGKSDLVEGALIGSLMAGVLLMPGCSMVSGGIKRKEQRFNAKSAEVTSTMLIMAIIGALTPTLFYQMFGSFELRCVGCPESTDAGSIACTRCYYDQLNPTEDPVYQNSVKPLMWLCAAILPSAYVIGIVFSLHTHVDMVWKKASHSHAGGEGGHGSLSYYQKLIPGHIISHFIHPHNPESTDHKHHHVNSDGIAYSPVVTMATPFPPPASTSAEAPTLMHPAAAQQTHHSDRTVIPAVTPVTTYIHAKEPEEEEEEAAGHDSPNWSKFKSFTILFGCTLLYSIIAEILVNTVDHVMDNLAVDEKFLGLTLFALVPNITEFMNAISFALYGNIVLSMEIGSAYALQVCLLQIPAMVAFSLWYNWGKEEVAKYTFSLVFPRWDVISVIFSVFLLTYTYQEGKSNYFKGSILILSYLVLMAGFYFIPAVAQNNVVDPRSA